MVVKKLQEAIEIYHPSVVLGELYYGAYNSKRQKDNLDKIDIYKNKIAILNQDENTAKFYGAIKTQLKQNGKPIPENDIWIAALAIQYGLTLVSRDKHFENIKELKIEKW
jgi:tRNA(fMet)-specific endonuclease VapC